MMIAFYNNFIVNSPPPPPLHRDLKVASFQRKIDENYANYFAKTKAKNKCFIVQKWQRVLKAFQHFKVDPVL